MLKKIAMTILSLFMFLSFISCATLNEGSKISLPVDGKTAVKDYCGGVGGFYLLNIPLITGNTEKEDAFFNLCLMKDTVNMCSVNEMVCRNAKEDGANGLDNLTAVYKSMYIFPVFFYKAAGVTAVGVK